MTVVLDAVAENWRRLRDRLRPGCVCGGVVKANGYGLGAAPVARALHGAGCRDLFVAQLDEGLRLAAAVPSDARVFVLSGPGPGTEAAFSAAGLVPVLNTLDQVTAWSAHARRDPPTPARLRGGRAPAAIQVDTGMTRVGLSGDDLDHLLRADASPLAAFDVVLVMSHLACADTPGHPLNAAQIAAFAAVRDRFPGVPGSLANSSGLFLGQETHHDLARPGVALYGVNPTPGRPNPMVPVIRLQGRILQVRRVDAPSTVGYGATHRAGAGTRIATVGIGYADGLPRASSGQIVGHAAETPLPLIGRVSMDLTTFDITAAGNHPDVCPGGLIDLIGPHTTVDDLAARAGTIGYEVLTGLGPRYARRYLDRPMRPGPRPGTPAEDRPA
nr:alanine racemase [Roseospira visakhapatnamensis]